MYIPRGLETRLQRLSRHFPAVAVSGARQTGKTTLLRHCFPTYDYVSLDLPSKAEQAETNPSAFLREHKQPVIIDEIQYAPGLLRHLKTRIDADRHANGRFLLTGSQHFSLMKGVSESLAGRIGMLDLETLSIAEIPHEADSWPTDQELIRLLVRGQFPELWRVPDFPASDFYAAYVATYLERDVRQILNVTSLRDFERFLRILAARSGCILNKSDVARDVGVSVKAIGDWISVLQTSGQILLLEPWFTNIAKRIVKTPKLYFADSGLLCYLLNLTAETLPHSQLLGPVWETFVFSELRKRISFGEEPTDLWFYRDQRAREIDFIIETGGRLSFLEVKWREQLSETDARTIRVVSDELAAGNSAWKPGHHFLLGTPRNSYELGADVTALGPNQLERIFERR
jgi:predicted AAA+ superfamily ATPase